MLQANADRVGPGAAVEVLCGKGDLVRLVRLRRVKDNSAAETYGVARQAVPIHQLGQKAGLRAAGGHV